MNRAKALTSVSAGVLEGAGSTRGAAATLPVTAFVATVFMAINAAVGLMLGFGMIDTSPGNLPSVGIVLGTAWALLAIGSAMLRPAARTGAMLVAGFSLVLAGRVELGTNVLILVLLVTPSSSRAFARR